MKSAAKVKYEIRKFRKGDIKEAIRNYYLRYEEMKKDPYLGVSTLKKKPSMKYEMQWANKLLSDIRNGDAIAVVGIVKGHVVGMFDIRVEGAAETAHVGIVGAWINKEYRFMGMGTAMLDYLIRSAKGRFEMLILQVHSQNKSAIALYRKMGFREYGMLPDGYKRGKIRVGKALMYRRI